MRQQRGFRTFSAGNYHRIRRRVSIASIGGVLVLALLGTCIASSTATAQAIDRQALVRRHNPLYELYTPEAPSQVGNGEFAFAFDITGMQTFPSETPGHTPLGTMAQWSWHRFSESGQYAYEQTLRQYNAHGRKVSYATEMRSDAATAFRSNPHRFNLARLSLKLVAEDGRRADVRDISSASQVVDLWLGEATSRFTFDGQPVAVRTIAHPTRDAVAFSIESPLVASGRVAIEVSFAYPAAVWGPKVDDWQSPERHETKLTRQDGIARLLRTLDDTQYVVDIDTTGEVTPSDKPHHFAVQQQGQEKLEAVIHFHQRPEEESEALAFETVRTAAANHGQEFWSTGGAVDLSGSTDPRWRELERRIVLSQYLTAIQCAGSMPPQETGLMCNSWYGKSHLEMHWWHAAHFPLWGRDERLKRSLGWYEQIMPAARAIAKRQGYAGVRWPKMTGPHGVSSPSEVGELLIWQQPHPIYFAELAYRSEPTRETLVQYQEVVEATADFMADYAHFDASRGEFVLGPVLIPAQECYEGRSASGVLNPTFELSYWRWALERANEWRERLGLPINPHWQEVAAQIARPTVRDGVYTAIENAPFTRRRDHPSMLAALGMLPDVGLIDNETMARTLADVDRDWSWEDTWGWDYPMMAMTAARLGQPEVAIDQLLRDTPKNQYLANGHCYQAARLPVYLPANGGLLSAIAMMAAGWDGSDSLGEAPGFPKDGTWKVRHEGLRRMP